MKKIRLLIIDEHPAVCQALVIRLQAAPSVEVVAATCAFTEGVDYTQTLNPDVILMELKGKGGNDLDSIAAISRLLAQGPLGVIVLTSYLDEGERDRALKAGASRYLLKEIDTTRLITEIEAVADEGGVLFSSQAASVAATS